MLGEEAYHPLPLVMLLLAHVGVLGLFMRLIAPLNSGAPRRNVAFDAWSLPARFGLIIPLVREQRPLSRSPW